MGDHHQHLGPIVSLNETIFDQSEVMSESVVELSEVLRVLLGEVVSRGERVWANGQTILLLQLDHPVSMADCQ